MSTENKETSHLNEEGFSKGEYYDDLDEQKLEAVTGGVDPLIMEVYLEHQQKLVKRTLGESAFETRVLRTESSPPKPASPKPASPKPALPEPDAAPRLVLRQARRAPRSL